MMQLTEARWSPTIKRVALTTAGFLPVSFVLFLVLFFGRAHAVSMGERRRARGEGGVAQRAVPVAAASASGSLLLYWVACGSAEGGASPRTTGRRRARRRWTAATGSHAAPGALRGRALAVGLRPPDGARPDAGTAASSAATTSVTSLYTGVRAGRPSSRSARTRGAHRVAPSAIQDVAKLTFAMCVMWMYFFFSQYLVIWYGNVPVETRFFRRGSSSHPGAPWRSSSSSWAGWCRSPICSSASPGGRPRAAPGLRGDPVHRDGSAVFLERLLVVFPSLLRGQHGAARARCEILVTAGFFALFVLSRNGSSAATGRC